MELKNNTMLLLGVRSALNVGAIARSCVAFDVVKIFTAPGTPYPMRKHDVRLPHIAQKAHKKISKTALGAEDILLWQPTNDVHKLLNQLKKTHTLIALEQHPKASKLTSFSRNNQKPWLLIVGHEVHGIDDDILKLCDHVLEIKHSPLKESLNVSVATGIALHHLYQTTAQQ